MHELLVTVAGSAEALAEKPRAVFDGQLVWETARLSFRPVRTGAVRLENIRRGTPEATSKNRDPKPLPIGIFDVVVFGQGQPDAD